MKYESISDNIILCKNFLPDSVIDLLYVDFLNNRSLFKTSTWKESNPKKKDNPGKPEFFSENCGGFDFWISPSHNPDYNSPAIKGLYKWFFHQGLEAYINANKYNSIFSLLYTRNIKSSIHVISYNKGGYYNWHRDTAYDTLITFNLILQKNSNLKGGNLLFMDGKIIEIPNQNNVMVVFPSFVDHAITPLEAEKDVSFTDQRFSIQYWVGIKS
jgi:hypothetical protein